MYRDKHGIPFYDARPLMNRSIFPSSLLRCPLRDRNNNETRFGSAHQKQKASIRKSFFSKALASRHTQKAIRVNFSYALPALNLQS